MYAMHHNDSSARPLDKRRDGEAMYAMHHNDSSARPLAKRQDGEAMYAMHHPKWTKNQHYGVHEITVVVLNCRYGAWHT